MRSLLLFFYIIFVFAAFAQDTTEVEDSFNAVEELSKIQLMQENDNMADGAELLADKRFIALYFSALWHEPSLDFLPELARFKEKCVQNQQKFGIVLVSLDKSEAELEKHIRTGKMNWSAIPYGNTLIKECYRKFRIEEIPTLVILDGNGGIVSKDARWDIHLLGIDAYRRWQLPDYRPLTYEDEEKLNRKASENNDTRREIDDVQTVARPIVKASVPKNIEKNIAEKNKEEKTSVKKPSVKKKKDKEKDKKDKDKDKDKDKKDRKKDKKDRDRKDKKKDKDKK